MERDQLCRANIENLISFWRQFGFETIASMKGVHVYASVDWPHRVWLDWETEPKTETVKVLLEEAKRTSRTVKVPVWTEPTGILHKTLTENGFIVSLRQACMVLKLEKTFEHEPSSKLVFTNVSIGDEADIWAEVASQSFGYYVPAHFIRRVIGQQGLKLFTAYWDNAPAASGLLFENNGVVGIHMVGVLPEYRRLGIARQLMLHLHNVAREAKAPYATLQASDQGCPLYEELGYEKQFEINTYSHPDAFPL